MFEYIIFHAIFDSLLFKNIFIHQEVQLMP